VRLEYTEPYFLSSHMSLNFEGRAWQAVEPVYSQDVLGGRASLRHQANQQTYWSVSLINEYQRSTITNGGLEDFTIRNNLIALGLDPRTGQTRGTTAAVAFDVNRNTTNNILDANRGYVLNGHVEQAGKWLWGTYNYWEVSGEARQYTRVARSFVWANRVHMGTIDALAGSAAVPFFKRYFLGGATSVRGWGRFEVSPLSALAFRLAACRCSEGSTEIASRSSASWAVSGSFFDFGAVSNDSLRLPTNQLVYAADRGSDISRPIGPARIDFGYQLNRIPNLRVNGNPEARHWRYPLQHRAGILMSVARRFLQVVAFVCTLIVGVGGYGCHRLADDVVQGVAARVHHQAGRRYVNGRLTIGRIDGNLFFGVEAQDIDITQNGQPVVSLKDVGIDYNFLTFLGGNVVLDHIRLNEPTLHLEKTATGWNLTQLIKAQTPNAPRNRRPIDIAEIGISGGTLYVDDTRQGEPVGTAGVNLPTVIDKIDASIGVHSDANELKVDVGHVALRAENPHFGVNDLSGKIRRHEDSITIENLALRTEETSLRVQASFAASAATSRSST
jgi:hypothetical protein